MFNRSKKYIILLLINIIILVVAYINSSNKPKDPFDTNYVISLLENESKFKTMIQTLERDLLLSNSREDDIRIQLEQTKLLITASEQKVNSCEAEKEAILGEAKLAAKNRQSNLGGAECGSLKLELSIAEKKAEQLTLQLSSQSNELTRVQEELIRIKQQQAQRKEQHDAELETLRILILELEQTLKEPITIQKNYLTARFCAKPVFTELICVEEFLVRPTFTKFPATKVNIKIVNPNNKTVIQGEFNSAKSQLFRLGMDGQTELPRGMYHVIYNVDNQTLRTESVDLSQ